MPDEASPSLFALSHQLIEGQNWLKRNLNYKPRAAWSIDPFGHGSVMPYLLKSSGLNGMMIQVISQLFGLYVQKTLRKILCTLWEMRYFFCSVCTTHGNIGWQNINMEISYGINDGIAVEIMGYIV